MFSPYRNLFTRFSNATQTRLATRYYHTGKRSNSGQGKHEQRRWVPSWITGGLALSIPVMPAVYFLSGNFDEEKELNVWNAFSVSCLAPNVPGDPITTKSKVLDKGADLMQYKRPVDSISLHLCAIHSYSGDPNRQVIAHHYCAHLTQDVHQCIIYDSDKQNARIIGVEYIISEKLFKTLPPEEKKLWHSHAYEITSGQLTMPGIPPVAEHAAMTDLVNTYGKTWHFWQVDRGDPLPLGAPTLMMALTKDGQINPRMTIELDAQTKVTSIESRRNARVDIQPHPVDKDANAWEKGEAFQLELKKL